MGNIDARRELATAVTMGWAVGVAIGTTLCLLAFGALGPGLLVTIFLFPVALPIAFFLSLACFVPLLIVARLFPLFILRHRAIFFGGLPFVVGIATLINGSKGVFTLEPALMNCCAVFDACLAAAWCFYFTSHVTDQA